MANSLMVNRDGIYDLGTVCLALDIRQSTLNRARREGRLKYAREGNRIFFLGKWLIEWLEKDCCRNNDSARVST